MSIYQGHQMLSLEQMLKNLEPRPVPTLKAMKIGAHEFMINTNVGYYPYFTMMLRKRIKAKKVINGVVTGEGGVGKSYQALDLCRVLSKRFAPEDIVFTFTEFMRTVLTSRRGVPIMFDEPSYAMSKKDWYKDLTKALVKTIESFRFKGKPLFIPVINKSFLEKDIRNHLLQFHVVMNDRGKATVYRIFPSQFKDNIYNYEICKLRYGMFDNNLCKKDSCLACPKLLPRDKSKRCMIFRAKYERIKEVTQQERYKKALEEAEDSEYSKLSLDEIQAKAMLHFDRFYNPDKDDVDLNLLGTILKREENIRVGHNKLYRLKSQIKYDNPKLFGRTNDDESPDESN